MLGSIRYYTKITLNDAYSDSSRPIGSGRGVRNHYNYLATKLHATYYVQLVVNLSSIIYETLVVHQQLIMCTFTACMPRWSNLLYVIRNGTSFCETSLRTPLRWLYGHVTYGYGLLAYAILCIDVICCAEEWILKRTVMSLAVEGSVRDELRGNQRWRHFRVSNLNLNLNIDRKHTTISLLNLNLNITKKQPKYFQNVSVVHFDSHRQDIPQCSSKRTKITHDHMVMKYKFINYIRLNYFIWWCDSHYLESGWSCVFNMKFRLNKLLAEWQFSGDTLRTKT